MPKASYGKTATIVLLTALLCLTACGGSDDSSAPPPSAGNGGTGGGGTGNAGAGSDTGLCSSTDGDINYQALMQENCARLSDFRLFSDPADPGSKPNGRGEPYMLASELFTDYAIKRRVLFLPEGKHMSLNGNQFEFPIGTVLVKSFYLPADSAQTDPLSAKLIETRLLIHRESGWTALPYVWGEGASGAVEAKLTETGTDIPHSLNRGAEALSFNYHVPSRAECKLCHQELQNNLAVIKPIGPKPLLLNRDINIIGSDEAVNQLGYFKDKGLITGSVELNALPRTYAITDEASDLTARAKGYLDVNCAHCHKATGFASVSGLRLGFEVDHQSVQYGICKQPPGWDGGERGLSYDIVPGNGDHSILVYRQTLSAPKDRMPPLGRNLVHQEAVEQISHWIDLMSPALGNCQ
ncbi:SO2930 family diheme c-type cytochrome [Shewanella sp.]|uniref:SO2930 family diheme c-type cytochrome n=1 Tax=Shewanella sp. TaxID=50422 RepID=UPI0035689EEA